MTATTGFYIHPYFCFRKYANSDYGFTCGFNVGPVAAVTSTAIAEVLHRPHVPAVLAVAGVPVTATGTICLDVGFPVHQTRITRSLQYKLYARSDNLKNC